MLNCCLDVGRISLIRKCYGEESAKAIEDVFSQVSINSSLVQLPMLMLLKLMDESSSSSGLQGDPYTVGNREIVVVNKNKEMREAINDISQHRIVGFDTEQRPVYNKGDATHPISIVQIATNDKCYIFQLQKLPNISPIMDIIMDKQIMKVGFTLANDHEELEKHYSTRAQNVLDLMVVFKKLTSRNEIGAKRAVWIFLRQVMNKKASIAKSNWGAFKLKPNQIAYAAEDACAPLDILDKMITDYPEICKVLPKKHRDFLIQ